MFYLRCKNSWYILHTLTDRDIFGDKHVKQGWNRTQKKIIQGRGRSKIQINADSSGCLHNTIIF